MTTANRINHPTFDLDHDTTLEERDMTQVKDARFQRNRDVMKSVDSHATETVFPKTKLTNERDLAATRIQAVYRGYQGRKQYIALLYEQFEREEAVQREKMMHQVEEGELLVENHRLEVELEDSRTTRRNKSRQQQSSAVTIQRAWRHFHENKLTDENQQQPMSVSNSNESLQLPKTDDNQPVEIHVDSNACHGNTPDDSSSVASSYRSGGGGVLNKNLVIDTDPESIVSDYSEMADTIKEHLANVQIIRKEDLDSGNTMQNVFLVNQKIPQLREETDAEYAKRLRKLNFLSLAQEFAELKKVDAAALPFGAHKTAQQLISPQSDTSSSIMSDSAERMDSSTTTPIESSSKPFPGGDAACNNINAQLPDNAKLLGNVNEGQRYSSVQAWGENKSENKTSENDLTDNTMSDSEARLHSAEISDVESSGKGGESLMEDFESTAITEETLKTQSIPTVKITSNEISINKVPGASPKEAFGANTKTNTKTNPENTRSSTSQSPKRGSNPQPSSSKMTSEKEEPDSESRPIQSSSRNRSKSPIPRYLIGQSSANRKQSPNASKSSSRSGSASPRRLNPVNQKTSNTQPSPGEDFDVYNIESTMPQMDWAKIEEELQKAAEEQKHKKSQKNDRQEILRKLAMAPEEEPMVFDADKALKKSNVQTRFQHGHGLQVCFMNEQMVPAQPNQTQHAPKPETATSSDKIESAAPAKEKVPQESEADLKTRQQRLQHEATIALAQVRPMAHMQLMVEKEQKQKQKKSPLAEIVGIPGLGDDKILELTHDMLKVMNVAQLQVVLNDLHSQIESLNMELMNQLVERDDLHMEQDSMLVDIEDLHRRAEELSLKVSSSILKSPKRKRDKKK